MNKPMIGKKEIFGLRKNRTNKIMSIVIGSVFILIVAVTFSMAAQVPKNQLATDSQKEISTGSQNVNIAADIPENRFPTISDIEDMLNDEDISLDISEILDIVDSLDDKDNDKDITDDVPDVDLPDKFTIIPTKEKRKVVANLKKDDSIVKVVYDLEFKVDEIDSMKRGVIINQILKRFAMSEKDVNSILKIRHGDDDHDDDHDHPGDGFDFNGRSDLNNDGKVDKLDLDILIAAWGSCPKISTSNVDSCVADLNDDGKVNVLDLIIMIRDWTREDVPKTDMDIKNFKVKVVFRENKVIAHIEIKFVSGLDRKSILQDTSQVTHLSMEDLLHADEFKIVNKKGSKDHDDEDDDDHDNDKDKKNKKEIKVEIDLEDGESEIKIRWNGKKIEYETHITDKEEILEGIAERLGLSVDEIRPYVKFKIDD